MNLRFWKRQSMPEREASAPYFDLEEFRRGLVPLRAKDPDFYANEVDPRLDLWQKLWGDQIPIEYRENLLLWASGKKTNERPRIKQGRFKSILRTLPPWSFPAGFVLLLVLITIGGDIWEEHEFNLLTPAQHLAQAKAALPQANREIACLQSRGRSSLASIVCRPRCNPRGKAAPDFGGAGVTDPAQRPWL